MKNCEYWQQQISRLLDGDLPPEQENALWEHIAGCPDCAQAFEDFSQQASVLRSQVVRPPVELSRLVMARIKNGRTDPVSFRAEKPVSHRLRPWKKLAAAACFVALVAAAAVTGVFSRGVPMSGGGDAAAYLPEARNGTAFASVPGRSAETAEAADAQEQSAQDALPAEAPAEEAGLSLPTEDAGPETPPAPEPETAPDTETAPDAADETAPAQDAGLTGSADSGIMVITEPAPTAEDGLPCPVFDAAGQSAGCIGDGDALAALLTGQPWQGEAPEPIYTLTLDGDAYAFAADGDGALLWQRGEEGWTLSPASLADLQALIT